ncbi:cyclic AMP-responsive element-binding protein 1 isoform X3 [Tribolium castaneum]|uniref:cyclic AMP-responsive element-binding protein 1 isoform X3 n=1 Tax=Tribolium castaneum TaxID=7070 RepID=UPI00077DE759|nr:PREDICTED: cyclic AMP-responsive element-binding protein 1 isoform X3 [Tribolium castaneum]|eukprot:XP_015840200.1 PREDICTED: cyclic AMP-responsive element-binding protein 1 isoform X3 [Tribolium castaneum]
MEGIVEENGAVDPLAPSPDPQSPIASVGVSNSQSHLMTATNIVQLTLPTQTQAQVQSVIQPNQQSVIQTAANIQPMLSKGNVILVSKPNSVIQTTQGSLSGLQTLQVKVVETGSEDSFSEEESPKKRRDLLTRRPSYRKILNDLGGETKVEQISSEADSELSSHSIPYHTVLPGAIQISGGKGAQGIHTLTMTNSTAGGAIVQYAQGQEFFVPGSVAVVAQGANISGGNGEDQDRKREMRLLKNREAARECRRKKKEYIKCLENRVAVLENQNKALIDELKSLKELYCQQKTE